MMVIQAQRYCPNCESHHTGFSVPFGSFSDLFSPGSGSLPAPWSTFSLLSQETLLRFLATFHRSTYLLTFSIFYPPRERMNFPPLRITVLFPTQKRDIPEEEAFRDVSQHLRT